MTANIPIVSIDTAIPVPEGVGRWPIKELKVGESFLFPIEKRASIQSAASRIKADTGYDYTVKKMDDINGRIWRTK